MALPNSEKITSQIAMLPDAALKQMAMMHKSDPYVLPLIISEDGRRKQMRQAAQAQMAMPQPKVADAALAQMGQLPEDQGIGRLPAPNMQRMADGGIAGYGDDANEDPGMAMGGMFDFAQRSEPVIRMAGGGIPGYKNAGIINPSKLTEKQEFAMQYKDLAEKVGKELGVDPGIIIAQWGMETGWGKKTIGQYNFGNIKDVTGKGPKAFDKKEKSRDSYKSYESPDEFAADYSALIKRNFPNAVGAGSDIGAFSAGLQSGKKGAYATDPNYEKVLANTFKNLPVGSAVAEETPKKVSAQPEKASLEDARGTAKAAGVSGIAGLTLPGALSGVYDAASGATAKYAHQPANVGPMQPPQALTTAQKIGRFFGAAGTPIAVFQGGKAATDKAMSDLQYMSPEQRREMSSNPMLSAMSGDAGFAAAIMDAAANNPEGPSKMPYKEQMTNVGKAILQHPDIERQRLAAEAKRPPKPEDTKPVYDPNKMEPVRYDEFGPPNIGSEALDKSKKELDDLASKAKEATPEEARKGLTNDDYLMMGLSLLANKSPNFATAFGEAGVQTLGAKREREKAAGEAEYKKAMTRQAGAYTDYLERGGKEKKLELEAEKVIQDYLESWDKNNKFASLQDPSARLREEKRIREQVYANIGIKPIMSQQAAPAASGGFRFVGGG